MKVVWTQCFGLLVICSFRVDEISQVVVKGSQTNTACDWLDVHLSLADETEANMMYRATDAAGFSQKSGCHRGYAGLSLLCLSK